MSVCSKKMSVCSMQVKKFNVVIPGESCREWILLSLTINEGETAERANLEQRPRQRQGNSRWETGKSNRAGWLQQITPKLIVGVETVDLLILDSLKFLTLVFK